MDWGTVVQRRTKDEPLDKGILMCFDATTGNFLWQHVSDKLESGIVNDMPNEGICSTPTVEGDRLSRSVSVAVDGTVSRLGLLQPVGEESEVHFLPAVAGG